MIVASGARLGPYQILAPLRAGGMGEVYRALDTRLDRVVAIKILSADLAGNPQRRLRFEREAKTISQLSHPNICTVYDFGREDGRDYLVMELLEGETLADRLDGGPLPMHDVLEFGTQIAEALDKAHRAGIVHRDLKPGNVMLTKSGVKLLDFGLAKEARPETSPHALTESSAGIATDHKPITQEGTIQGTLQYMAPEQLEDQRVDGRADIFALGVVLYEMATGKHAFSGKSKASLIAAIVSSEPAPVNIVQPLTPPALEHVIRKCLEKDRDARWQSAHDVATQLRWIGEGAASGRVAASSLKSPLNRRRILVGSVIAAAILAAAAIWLWRRAAPSEAPVVRLAIPYGSEFIYTGSSVPLVAVSPDGRRIVYVEAHAGRAHLYMRLLDRFESVLIPGSAGATGSFFSPDGQWIAFFTLYGKLNKVPVAGGAVQPLAPALAARGGTWAVDDSIYYAPSFASGLWKVGPGSLVPREVTRPDVAQGENSHRWPEALPDGKHLLFTIRTSQLTTFDDARIALLSLETGKWRTLIDGGSHAKYLATGDIVFARGGSLYIVPFDLDSLTTKGAPVPIVSGVITERSSGAAQYDVAEEAGTLIYLPGVDGGGQEVLSVDRKNVVAEIAQLSESITSFRVSPQQDRMALQVAAANDDIYVYDFQRGSMTRVSFEPGDEFLPSWTPDGKRLVFASARGLLWQPADGSSPAELLLKGNVYRGSSVSPDGRFVLYSAREPGSLSDLWILPLTGDRKPRALITSPYNEFDGTFSPDGQWILYISDESGGPEVYLRSLRDSGRWQISNGGGLTPRWSGKGNEVFYRQGDGVFAVPVAIGPRVSIGKPRLLFSMPHIENFEVFRDGFLLVRPARDDRLPETINVVTNWFSEVRAAGAASK